MKTKATEVFEIIVRDVCCTGHRRDCTQKHVIVARTTCVARRSDYPQDMTAAIFSCYNYDTFIITFFAHDRSVIAFGAFRCSVFEFCNIL